MSTPLHFPQPWLLVRRGRIVAYAWSRTYALDALSSYACASWLKGAKVYPNPSVSISAAIAPRLES